jgi:hypothetical protein
MGVYGDRDWDRAGSGRERRNVSREGHRPRLSAWQSRRERERERERQRQRPVPITSVQPKHPEMDSVEETWIDEPGIVINLVGKHPE